MLNGSRVLPMEKLTLFHYHIHIHILENDIYRTIIVTFFDTIYMYLHSLYKAYIEMPCHSCNWVALYAARKISWVT